MKNFPLIAFRIAAGLTIGALAVLRAADRVAEKAPAPETASAPVAAPAERVEEKSAPAPASNPPPSTVLASKEKGGAKPGSAKKGESESAPKAAPVLPQTPRFQQVRDRINVLYGNRDVPPPPIDARHNPFRSQPIAAPASATAATAAPGSTGSSGVTGSPVGSTSTEVAPPPVNPNIALVKQAAALLRVTGFVERDGRTLLNINQALYREGETVKVAVKGQSVLLRIKKLSRTSLTVTLGEAEHTINF